MKILFAVSNDNISNSIIKNYQDKYKEIITSKNVYYFNAIIKELQKDKSYDVIVIGEDLEPISNNNYDTIDKFIFEKLDSISDEAYKPTGEDIPIILICSDRRTKSDALLIKLFGIGIYNALLGNDRNINTVCNLINKPRSKKEAKIYYRVDSEEVNYKPESEEEVSETEIQNILAHYKKIGNNEKKCVESFNSIASQYNDTQLRIITKFLPLNVKAILEANSTRYQQLMSNGTVLTNGKYNRYEAPTSKNIKKQNMDLLTKDLEKTKLTKPVVIPSTMNIEPVTPQVRQAVPQNIQQVQRNQSLEPVNVGQNVEQPNYEQTNILQSVETEPVIEAPKKRGRPKKVVTEEMTPKVAETTVKRGRGRPKKVDTTIPQEQPIENAQLMQEIKPIQNIEPVQPIQDIESVNPTQETIEPLSEDINLFDLTDNNTNNDFYNNDVNLFDMENSPYENQMQQDIMAQNDFAQNQTQPEPIAQNNFNQNENLYNDFNVYQNEELVNTKSNNVAQSNFIAQNSKIVAFVGTSKNGTSFIVNNLAELLSQKGIKTAILDLTKNKNSYYMFTDNDQKLMSIAGESIRNLAQGNIAGVDVNKNLTVFTSLPGDDRELENFDTILQTLDNNYSAVLMDCDFDTNINYFVKSTEIYLVQSMDALTIQPLTLFLSELKLKNALDETKLRVIINKEVKLKILTTKMILGGMAKYNEPSMTLQRDLFNPNTIKYVTIPFEEQTYARYLEAIALCQISLSGYSAMFMNSLENLASMVYPLIPGGSNQNYSDYSKYSPNYEKANKKGWFGSKSKKQIPTQFSSDVNGTLNKMRSNY